MSGSRHEHEHGNERELAGECCSHEHEHADACGCYDHEGGHADACGCHDHEGGHADACGCHDHEGGHADACGCHDDECGHEHGGCGCGCDHEEIESPRGRVLLGISGTTLVAGLVIDLLVRNERLAIPFYVIAAIAGLVFIAPMALSALRRRTADMNVLMGIAVLGALIMGLLGDTEVFRDAAIVIFLDQIGELLEDWSMRKTTGSIKELMELTPDVAHVVDDEGRTRDCAVGEVREGQCVRILPGERVPLDGIILQGISSFNEAPVTGESIPQDKGEGAQVFAGSLNTSAVVDMQVTADEDCTTIARIISLVQGAQAEKAPYESFVDRFAASYTPIVIVGALVVGVAVPLVLSLMGGFAADTWHDWVYRALSLLVVACPCALVLSTPVSFVSALTRAAKNGVLVKGGAYFDIATKVDTMAFDKTGTLTTGSPQVTRVLSYGGATEAGVLQTARTLEESSTHPLARAVVLRAEEEGLAALLVEGVEEIAACGMRGQIEGVTCLVGKISFAREHAAVDDEVAHAVEELGGQGASALVVCADGRVVGVIGVADAMRPRVAETLAALRREGVSSTTMLTGDNRHTAAAVAAQLGLTDYAAELLPDGKVAHIQELQRSGGCVAMVGDGLNDAPALATADLGITMGAAASDTSLEVADVALLSDDLGGLPSFFALATKTMRVVRENIAFAIGVKLLVFALVIAGVAGMGAAVFADTGVALLVILNGLRLMLDSKLRW